MFLSQSTLASLQPVLEALADSGKWFLICAAVFIPLARLFPGKASQPLFHRGMVADIIYWFCGPLFYKPVAISLTTFLLTNFYSNNAVINRLILQGLSPVKDLPVAVQALLMLFITDCVQYWTHRLFHQNILWKFHAIHHAPKVVDWLTSVRFHPINIFVHSTLVSSLVYLIGFSPAAFAMLLVFNNLYSPLVHANLNWDYGPFRYVLASPVFHRWHHTYPQEGCDKNFAPTFAFLDVLFGTFYMPKGRQPTVFGAPYNSVPEGVVGQLAYPFQGRD